MPQVKRMYFIKRDGIYLSWNDKSNRFNSRSGNLVGSSNLTLGHLQSTTGEETHSALGVRRLVFGKGEK